MTSLELHAKWHPTKVTFAVLDSVALTLGCKLVSFHY